MVTRKDYSSHQQQVVLGGLFLLGGGVHLMVGCCLRVVHGKTVRSPVRRSWRASMTQQPSAIDNPAIPANGLAPGLRNVCVHALIRSFPLGPSR